MPPKKKGVTVIKTGSTHKKMDTYDKTINGVKYTLFVPQRDCHNEMGKPYSKTINDIARREGYAQNGDEPDKWIAAIQKVFDNHYDEIKDVDGYKEFHQKKVYFLNARAGERGFCTYIAVQRKPYKDQTGDAKKKPKRNKTRKKAPAKGKKGKVSEDGSGFIPASAMSRQSLNSDSDSSSAIQSLDSDEDAIENPLGLIFPQIDSDHKKNPKAFPALRKGNPLLKNLDYNKMKGKFPDEWKKGEGKNGEPKWWKKLFVLEGDDKTLYPYSS